MSLSTTSKKFLCQQDILKEINMIKFMIDNLKKEKSKVFEKPISNKRKYDFVTDNYEDDSYDSDEEYVENVVKYYKPS